MNDSIHFSTRRFVFKLYKLHFIIIIRCNFYDTFVNNYSINLFSENIKTIFWYFYVHIDIIFQIHLRSIITLRVLNSWIGVIVLIKKCNYHDNIIDILENHVTIYVTIIIIL